MFPTLRSTLVFLLPSLLSATSIPQPNYGTITTTSLTPSIIRATISNPPINLYDYRLASDLYTFLTTLDPNKTTLVILASANPDFFIAHYDIHFITNASPPAPPANSTLVASQILESVKLLSTSPIIFVAEVNGRASGAGNEILLQCDIRYAGPSTRLSQVEVTFGTMPGAGGLQYLVNLIGRARALEYVLSGNSVDSVTAAQYGWVNKHFGTKEELKEGVEALARQIAKFPGEALGAIKSSVNLGGRPEQGWLDGDNLKFVRLAGTAFAQRVTEEFLKVTDNESAGKVELGLDGDWEAKYV